MGNVPASITGIQMPMHHHHHHFTSPDQTDGAQNFFPVYEPDHDVLLRKHREAEEKSRQAHYDTSKEGE